MSQKRYHILRISRPKIEYYCVDLDREATISNQKTLPNDPPSLQMLQEWIASNTIQSVRILLQDDAAYTLRFSIPDEKKEDMRSIIFSHVIDVVPETISDSDWDYKIIKSDSTLTEVFAFVPVIALFRPIQLVLQELNCSIEAVEPSVAAGKRNQNPVIGLALKTDIKGKDSDSLNLSLRPEEPNTDTNTSQGSVKYIGKRTWVIVSITGIFVVGILILVYVFVLRPSPISPSPVDVTKREVPTVLPTNNTKRVPDLDKKAIKIQVNNGTTIAGLAGVVKQALLDEGFEQIQTGNAEKSDATSTSIQVKESSQSAQIMTLAKQILANSVIEIGLPLQNDSNFDLLIIVGKDYEK